MINKKSGRGLLVGGLLAIGLCSFGVKSSMNKLDELEESIPQSFLDAERQIIEARRGDMYDTVTHIIEWQENYKQPLEEMRKYSYDVSIVRRWMQVQGFCLFGEFAGILIGGICGYRGFRRLKQKKNESQ
jgi:hypothetical protein